MELGKVRRFSYGVDGIRWALTSSSYFSPWMLLGVLVVLMVALLLLGAYSFSRMRADS